MPDLCRLDVRLDDVVFREGEAVMLLDFDFDFDLLRLRLAAPGDPLDDLASMARTCVPVDDGVRREQLVRSPLRAPRDSVCTLPTPCRPPRLSRSGAPQCDRRSCTEAVPCEEQRRTRTDHRADHGAIGGGGPTRREVTQQP